MENSTNDDNIKYGYRKCARFLYPIKQTRDIDDNHDDRDDILDTVMVIWNAPWQKIHLGDSKNSPCFFKLDLPPTTAAYTQCQILNFDVQLSFEKSHQNLRIEDLEIILQLEGNSNFKGSSKFLKVDNGKNEYSAQFSTEVDTLATELIFSVFISCDVDNIRDFNFIDDGKKLLLSDVLKIHVNDEFSDVEIKVDDRTFKVHKVILSSRSDVLAKMIESDMIEKKTGEITLKATNSSAVAELCLAYIYTGRCNVGIIPHELFKLAHFLQLSDLQARCANHLLDKMSCENIVDILLLTDEYHLPELSKLKAEAKKFVDENELDLIKRTDFKDYLFSKITMRNLFIALRLANKYQLKKPLKKVFKFMKLNYNKVLEDKECNKFLSVHGDLMTQIWQYSLKNCNCKSNEKEGSDESQSEHEGSQ